MGYLIDTQQRVNPAEGLLSGVDAGMKYGLAFRQQRMAEKEQARLIEAQKKQDDLRQLTVLLDAYGKVKSKTGKAQLGQAAFNILGKLNPELQGVSFVHDEGADNFMTKARGLKKLLVENPDLGIKEIDNLLQEAAEEQSKGNIERQEYQDIEKSAAGVKKEAAGALASDITLNQPYTTKETAGSEEAAGLVREYNRTKLAQMSQLDPALAVTQGSLLQREKADREYKPPQPWGFISAPDGTQKAVGFDPNSKKVVSYDMPYNGQVTPFTLGRTPASEIKTGTALDTLKDNIERIKTSYKPEYVGFFMGRAKQLQANTVGGIPEQQAAFYADVNDISDMLLRARSGAQINEQEYARLLKLVPTPNLPEGTFKARLERFETQLNQTLANQQRRLKQGGYIAPAIKGTQPAKKSVQDMSDEELLNSL